MDQHLIQAQLACSRLCNDFAFFVDSRAYGDLVSLFVEEGTFERKGEVLRGRGAILAAMQARPESVVTRHACTNIRVDLQADGTARGTCTLLLFHGAAGAAPGITVAEYHDAYVQTPGGWRIQSRVAHIVF
jgi:hypothetical protein